VPGAQRLPVLPRLTLLGSPAALPTPPVPPTLPAPPAPPTPPVPPTPQMSPASHTFVVPSRRAPSWGPVAAEVGAEGLVVAEGAPTPAWPVGVLHVHEDGTSARGVEVERTADGIHVRIPPSAAPMDWDLGLRFVRAFAGLLDAPIFRADREAPYDPVELAARYNGKALVALLAVEFDATVGGAEAEPVSLDGAVRPVVLGPTTVARLRAAGPPEERGLRLADLIGRIQWVEHEACAVANVLEIVSPDGRAFSAATLVPGRRWFLPASPHVLLADPGSDEAPLVVPRASLPAWLGEGLVEMLDELQAIVLLHRGSAWDDAWDRAAAHVIVRVQQSVPDVAPPAPSEDDVDLGELDLGATPTPPAREARPSARRVAPAAAPAARAAAKAAAEAASDDDEPTHEGPRPPLPPPPGASGPKKPWWRFW